MSLSVFAGSTDLPDPNAVFKKGTKVYVFSREWKPERLKLPGRHCWDQHRESETKGISFSGVTTSYFQILEVMSSLQLKQIVFSMFDC